MKAYVTELKVAKRHYKKWLQADLGMELSSHTDFYICKLFGPDADTFASMVGLRAGLRSKEGIWGVIGRKTQKKLVKLGAVVITDEYLQNLDPVKEESDE